MAELEVWAKVAWPQGSARLLQHGSVLASDRVCKHSARELLSWTCGSCDEVLASGHVTAQVTNCINNKTAVMLRFQTYSVCWAGLWSSGSWELSSRTEGSFLASSGGRCRGRKGAWLRWGQDGPVTHVNAGRGGRGRGVERRFSETSQCWGFAFSSF